MLVKGFGMSKKELVRFNRVHKHQQTTFLSDIAMTKGGTINKLLVLDWQKTHEGLQVNNNIWYETPNQGQLEPVRARIYQDPHTNVQAALPTGHMATSLGTCVEALL